MRSRARVPRSAPTVILPKPSVDSSTGDRSSAKAVERLHLLADTGKLLATSLDLDAALESMGRLAVQWFADACVVQLFSGTRVTAAAVAARDPALEAATRRAVFACRQEHARPNASLARMLESGRPELAREVDETCLRELSADNAQYEAICALGLLSVLRAPLLARGTVLGVVTLGRTKGEPFDEDDLALAAELARRAGLAFDNARLYKRAHDAVALRDEFLSIASHELNTPLTPLKMHLEALRRRSLPPERVQEGIDAALRQVTRLSHLVAEMLDVSQMGEEELGLEAERFDLAVLLDDVVSRMAEQASRAGSRVEVNAEHPCLGTWDRRRVDQVIAHLLSNALKFGAGQAIDVTLAGDDRSVRLVVHDRGTGIPAEAQRRIFERFGRATSARHYGGFGLGLWIVRRVVDESGGKVFVESEPGRGTTFTVVLPRERQDVAG
jgi:signal transduction histidine kinase